MYPNVLCLSASQIWELAKNQDNTMDFAEAIDSSDLEFFGFTDDFIFELWGAVTDESKINLDFFYHALLYLPHPH